MKTSIKAIIVDDEEHAIQLLRKVLTLFPNNVEVIGEANNLPEAIRLINSRQPDLVFMDIDMPNYSGLQVQDFFEEDRGFKLVYVTAHNEYAIDALRMQAFDYLLKPIELDQLKKCVQRLNDKLATEQNTPSGRVDGLEQKIAVSSHQGINYIDLHSVKYIEASSMYSIIHTEEDQIIVSKPLKEFEYLFESQFYRVHRSFLVNSKKVKRFSNLDGTEIELKDGSKIAVARSKKEDFKRFMSRTFGLRE